MKDSFSFFYSSRNSKKFHFPSFLFVQYAAIDRIVLAKNAFGFYDTQRDTYQSPESNRTLLRRLRYTSSCSPRATKKGGGGKQERRSIKRLGRRAVARWPGGREGGGGGGGAIALPAGLKKRAP